MGGRDLETVMLLPHRMNMRLSRNSSNQEPVELPLFNIIRWELTQRNNDCRKEGIRMVAVLRRKPWREVFTTYLPTILLIMTTYVTTFFKPQFFEAALGANLTTMLMMTTIFMTSLSELTDTAYAKWIDVWLIFSQLVPFTEVILLTLKEAFKEEAENGEEKNQGEKRRRRRRKRRTHTASDHSMATNAVQPDKLDEDITVVQGFASQVSDKKVLELQIEAGKVPKEKLFYVKLTGKTKQFLANLK